MPISRREFREEDIDLGIPVYDLLASRPDLAFTVEEIRNLLAQRAWRDAPLTDIEEALEGLLSERLIERKELGGLRWYTVVETEQRRLGFLRD